MTVDSFLDDDGNLSAVQVSRINNMPRSQGGFASKEYGLGHPLSIFGRPNDACPVVIRFEEMSLRCLPKRLLRHGRPARKLLRASKKRTRHGDCGRFGFECDWLLTDQIENKPLRFPF